MDLIEVWLETYQEVVAVASKGCQSYVILDLRALAVSTTTVTPTLSFYDYLVPPLVLFQFWMEV